MTLSISPYNESVVCLAVFVYSDKSTKMTARTYIYIYIYVYIPTDVGLHAFGSLAMYDVVRVRLFVGLSCKIIRFASITDHNIPIPGAGMQLLAVLCTEDFLSTL